MFPFHPSPRRVPDDRCRSWPVPLLVVALSLSAVATSGCRDDSARRPAASGDTAFVGVAVGLTSPERYVNVFEGVQMALEQLNSNRQPGEPALAMRRAPTTAKSAVDVAVAFRDDPSVIGVVGHTESAATISAAAVYADRDNNGRDAIVAVSPTAGAPAVTRASEWVFRVCPTSSAQARALARFIADSLGLRQTAVLYRNDPSGKDVLRVLTAEFGRAGGTVTERDPFMEDIVEFDAYARRLARAHTPSAVIAGNTTEERPFLRALRKAGGTAVVLGTNPPEVGDSAAAEDLRGVRFVQLFSAAHPPTPEGVRFADDFKKRTGKVADRWGALGYDAAMLIGLAAQAKGADRRGIRDWIARVGRGQAAYSGATGVIAFDENRDPVNKTVLVAEAGK
jgi:branched-chain amino acid transport system substrate-binding protein